MLELTEVAAKGSPQLLYLGTLPTRQFLFRRALNQILISLAHTYLFFHSMYSCALYS